MVFKLNNVVAGGKILAGSNEEVTVIPTVLMAEGVTNGSLKQYDKFKKHAHWFEGVPIIGPHKPGDPPVNHHTKKVGQVRNVRLNEEMKRVEADTFIFNSSIHPDDLKRIQNGEQFGGSIGYWADDIPIGNDAAVWPGDGRTYDKIEDNWYGDHFSMVPNPACPLGKCGFNVNTITTLDENSETYKTNKEHDNMTENVEGSENPVEQTVTPAIKENAVEQEVPTSDPLATVMQKLNAIEQRLTDLEDTASTKDAEVKTLKEAEEVRQNAAKQAQEDIFYNMIYLKLNKEAQLNWEAKHKPAIKENLEKWLLENINAFSAETVTVGAPVGQPFVPTINAGTDETEHMIPSLEETMKRVK